MSEPRKPSTALARVEHAPVARVDDHMTVDDLVSRVAMVQHVRERVMRSGTHYGAVPGTDKPTLLQPGADTLALAFRLAPAFALDERGGAGEHLDVTVVCTLTHAPTGVVVASGVGSASSRESKYAWRRAARTCPACGKELRRSKDKDEYYCWRKTDGCGSVYSTRDPSVASQEVGRVPNPDLPDTYNTIRKMACKRAKVAAVLNATAASDMFTQDLDDLIDASATESIVAPAPDAAPRKRSTKFGTVQTWRGKIRGAADEAALKRIWTAFNAVREHFSAQEIADLASTKDRRKAALADAGSPCTHDETEKDPDGNTVCLGCDALIRAARVGQQVCGDDDLPEGFGP